MNKTVLKSTVLVKSSRIWMLLSRSYRYRRGALTVVVVAVLVDGENSESELSKPSSKTLGILSVVVEYLIMMLLTVAVAPSCPTARRG